MSFVDRSIAPPWKKDEMNEDDLAAHRINEDGKQSRKKGKRHHRPVKKNSSQDFYQDSSDVGDEKKHRRSRRLPIGEEFRSSEADSSHHEVKPHHQVDSEKSRVQSRRWRPKPTQGADEEELLEQSLQAFFALPSPSGRWADLMDENNLGV